MTQQSQREPQPPTIDPTKNVLEHVAAAVRRLDDMRMADHAFLVARLSDADRLNDEKIEHARSIIRLRSEYTQLLREAEAQRLDANRQFDQLAVTKAADSANLAIQALAASQAATAESARNSLNQALQIFDNRLAVIERAIYEGKGKDVGATDNTKMIFGILSAILTLISIGSFVFAATRGP
jgi:hypothetical protein